MDTKKDSAVGDVPSFRIARVGKDRKRKGGGLAFLRGASRRGVWVGAAGASGAPVNALGLTFSKAILSVIMTAGIGSGAIYMGASSASSVKPAPAKPAIFAPEAGNKDKIAFEGDVSNLPATPNTIPNSLGYLSGSADGLTPEERAKQAADAAAAAEAARIAEEEAAKKAEEADAAANAAGGEAENPAVDPAALLAAAQADGAKSGKASAFDKSSAFGKKFGALSSSVGGGASSSGGSSGLSGGFNRSFGPLGSGGKGFSGRLSATGRQSRPTISRAGRAAAGSSKMKGFAKRQLDVWTQRSRRAAQAGGKHEFSKEEAGLDGIKGDGNVIGNAGAQQGQADARGTPDQLGTVNSGGPLGDKPLVTCGANEYQNPNGGCSPISIPKGQDVTPYKWMYQVAEGLMAMMTILAGIALLSHSLDWLFGAGEVIRMAVRVAMGAIGAILMGLGAMMIAETGDQVAGGIIFAVGAYTAYTAIYLPEAAKGEMIKAVAKRVFIANIVGGFGAAMAHKPAAAAQ